MGDTDILAGVAALLGEPARTRMLTALLTRCALTAKELAYFAGVTAPPRAVTCPGWWVAIFWR
jgi:hypothetical protein